MATGGTNAQRPVDANPTPNSANPVSSGGVYNEINKLLQPYAILSGLTTAKINGLSWESGSPTGSKGICYGMASMSIGSTKGLLTVSGNLNTNTTSVTPNKKLVISTDDDALSIDFSNIVHLPSYLSGTISFQVRPIYENAQKIVTYSSNMSYRVTVVNGEVVSGRCNSAGGYTIFSDDPLSTFYVVVTYQSADLSS